MEQILCALLCYSLIKLSFDINPNCGNKLGNWGMKKMQHVQYYDASFLNTEW